MSLHLLIKFVYEPCILSWAAERLRAEMQNLKLSLSWGCATDLNETHSSLFPLNRVAALLNMFSCHRPRAVCPARAQLVCVQSWPHQLLSPPALLMQLARTLLTAKSLFLQLRPWCLSHYIVFLLFRLTCSCSRQQGLFVILMSFLCH